MSSHHHHHGDAFGAEGSNVAVDAFDSSGQDEHVFYRHSFFIIFYFIDINIVDDI